jgi:hypothetical protein
MIVMKPEDDKEGFAFALLDAGYSKQEAAKAAGLSVVNGSFGAVAARSGFACRLGNR